MKRTAFFSILAFAAFASLAACKKAKPCGEQGAVDKYPQKFTDLGLVVDGASVCTASDSSIDEEIRGRGWQGNRGLPRAGRQARSEGVQRRPDPDQDPGTHALRLHRDLFGVEVRVHLTDEDRIAEATSPSAKASSAAKKPKS